MNLHKSAAAYVAASLFTSILNLKAAAQALPVGTPLLEETARRFQVTGQVKDNRSFAIRPLYATTLGAFDSLLFPAVTEPAVVSRTKRQFANGKGDWRLMPIWLRQQTNTHHPYGWNDGAMIPAKCYQALASAGVFFRYGRLAVQLQPEFVIAANKPYPTLPAGYSDSIWYHYFTVLNRVDAPERFGNGTYSKLLPGQSSIRFNFGKMSAGISTENLWWGPGLRNSLMMSNTAPGFPHLTFNTNKPVKTAIGSFEWQLVAGRLRNSGFLPTSNIDRRIDDSVLYTPKPNSQRYFNALTINWQPKWAKGLYLGFSRAFYQYDSTMPRTFNAYLPVLGAFFKSSSPAAENAYGRDQMMSLSFRMVLPGSKAEIYGEYGRNDHSLNLRDLLLEPEHARAFVLGARKFFRSRKGRELSWFIELTQLQRTSTIYLREQESWYTHYQVRHGYTHLGQVLGAGIGPGGSNSQSMGIHWYQGVNRSGLTFERVVRDNDFFFNAFTGSRSFMRHWVDFSLNYEQQRQYKRFIFSGQVNMVRSLNYQWRQRSTFGPKDVFNLFAHLAVGYRL